MSNWNNFIYINFSWNFNFVLNNFIISLFNNLYSANNFLHWNNFFNYFLDNVFLSNICIDGYFDNFNSFFKHWYLNYFFYLNDLSWLDQSINYLFNNLWYFNNLFDNSWYDNDLLNNFLNLYNFWNFNHFFNDFINIYSNLFNSLDCLRNLYYFLNSNLNWIVDSHFDCFNSLYLNYFRNLYYFLYVFFNFNNDWILYFLNNNLCNNLWHTYNFLLDYWNFYSSVYNLFNLSNDLDSVSNHSFNLFYSLFIDYFLFNNFNLFNYWDFNSDLNYLFNNFRNLYNSLDILNQRNWYFMDNLFDFSYLLDVVNNLLCNLNLNLFSSNISCSLNGH